MTLRGYICLLAAASLVAAVTVLPAFAAPSDPPRDMRPTVSAVATATVGPARITVVATDTAVPADGSFDYTVRAEAQALDYLQVRMRLLEPTGRIIYQKTYVEPAAKPGAFSFRFDRSLADIGLDPGVYPIEFSVRAIAGDVTGDALVPGGLLVYDAEADQLPVALVVRVAAQPLSDPQGRLVADPGQFSRARDDVLALASAVLDDSDLRVTLAIPPMILEEWARIRGGYQIAAPEGVVDVGAGSAVPLAYGQTLDTLQQAVSTGRLELVRLGYADPNLSELEDAGLAADVNGQYAAGLSRAASSLEASVSTGTAPAGGCVSDAVASRLAQLGVRYVVAQQRWTRTGRTPATPGAHRGRDQRLTVLVSDDTVARSLVESGVAEANGKVFSAAVDETEENALPVLLTVGPAAGSMGDVIELASRLARAPWAELVLGRDAATPDSVQVRLLGCRPDDRAPEGYWGAVRSARRWASALASATGAATPEALDTTADSLVAQGSMWAGANGTWAGAERGAAFAASAERTARTIVGVVAIGTKPITLAGTKGEVPITITNASERDLQVTLVTAPSRGVRLGSASRRQITLRPQDNFVEIPVELMNVASGDLAVRVIAGDVQLAATTVRLQGSFLDRLAMLGGIVVVLGGLLAFIIMRVRSAEPENPCAEEVAEDEETR